MAESTEQCIVHIVDDDDLVRKALARLMRASGYVAKMYDDPECFLYEISVESPGCILLDITMPHMSGLQVQERLKKLGIASAVIAVSARDDDKTRERARELGVRCFLRKPVDDQALLDAIYWVMQQPRGSETAAAWPANPRQAALSSRLQPSPGERIK
jgi:two-component system response regulator FixJ